MECVEWGAQRKAEMLGHCGVVRTGAKGECDHPPAQATVSALCSLTSTQDSARHIVYTQQMFSESMATLSKGT